MRGLVAILVVALICFAAAKEGCEEAQVAGMCRGYFPRFWFNPDTKACDEFIYGGCGGNANNYMTEDACRSACLAA